MAAAAVDNQVAEVFTRIAVALESLVAAQHLPKPAPAMFGGSSDAHNVEIFFQQFEQYATSLYGADNAVHLQILPNFLDGEPREIALAYGPSAEYAIVKQRIISEQNRRKSLGSNPLTDFLAMQRRSGESLVVLSIRLETALNKIQHLDQDGRKIILHSKLLSLMHPEAVKRMNVQFCNRADVELEDIINLGLKLEDIFPNESDAPALKVPALTSNTISAKASVPSPRKPKNNPDGIATSKAKHRAPATFRPDVPCASRATKAEHSNSINSLSQYAEYRCHRCHNYGHIRKLCTVHKPQTKVKLPSVERHFQTNTVKPLFSESLSNVPKHFYTIASINGNASPSNENSLRNETILPFPSKTADDSYDNLFLEFDEFPTIKEFAKSPPTKSLPNIDGGIECANLSNKSSPTESKSQTANCYSKIPSVIPVKHSYAKPKSYYKIGTVCPIVK